MTPTPANREELADLIENMPMKQERITHPRSGKRMAEQLLEGLDAAGLAIVSTTSDEAYVDRIAAYLALDREGYDWRAIIKSADEGSEIDRQNVLFFRYESKNILRAMLEASPFKEGGGGV